MLALAGTFALVSLGLFAPEDDKELALLEGKWKIVAFEADGSKVPLGKFKSFTLTLKGNRSVATHVEKGENGEEKELRQEGTIKINPAKTPKWIDFMPDVPKDEKEKRQLAIYKLEGDKLIFCSARLGGENRPASFEPRSKVGITLMTLQRVK